MTLPHTISMQMGADCAGHIFANTGDARVGREIGTTAKLVRNPVSVLGARICWEALRASKALFPKAASADTYGQGGAQDRAQTLARFLGNQA